MDEKDLTELPLVSGYILDELCEHHDLIPHFVRSAENNATRVALEKAANDIEEFAPTVAEAVVRLRELAGRIK